VFIKHFEKNTQGRDFFTTDIHGHFDLLHDEMRSHAFDTSVDRLFVGGDNCDRGPNSEWILDYINEPWYHSVRGNHEQMVISVIEDCDQQALNMLSYNGGMWFFQLEDEIKMAVYESFKSLPLAISVETDNGLIGIIHAELPYDDWEAFKGITKAELEWNGAATAQWARSRYDKGITTHVKGLNTLYVGHTPTHSGCVELLGNVVYADLGSFFRGKISFIQIQ
jgi:serine/threonine protein phosphatase 1